MKRIVKAPQDLQTLLQTASSNMANISVKAQSLQILADIVRQTCPDLPEDAWQIANCRENLVILEAKSSVWGQRLQFERNNIASQLSLQTQGIFNRIEIKVNPFAVRKQIKEQEPAKEKKSMSAESAEELRKVAENAPDGLKQKLLKLASHVKQKNNQ
ncbi:MULTISPECIES: DUF721 domain-containing protein [unclassified Thalassotalea]|uniref:DUF721 domain-containing protein n=1 Tax=unclassified Thalassotalea TaxID=2614972 RepID=UPI001081E82B|nr:MULTISPECIES: DUF721 domain-containing protein [unclassified Thalassotalea]NMP15783.1 DUF721 domain-containing protein [Thalassotalea sp. Y01]QBY04831.1 DUF721 domain-containing protein [Thalassotalea sp. HSM 43]